MNTQRSKTRRALLALIGSAALVATALIAAPFVGGNTISPAGCEDNGITLSIGRSPAVAQPGQTITYTVNVSNGVTGSADKPCDVTGATVTIDLPSPTTGLPSGSPEILVSNHDFPANGSGNIGPISRTFTVPPGPLSYGAATAQAGLSNALLHDNEFVDDFADTTKSVSATIVDANISITPSATNEVGTPHTFTAHVNSMVGTGVYANAADGTLVTFTIDSDTATSLPNPPTSCVTSGGTGSCTTTISSATPGVTVVSAHATRTLAGITVTRDTNGAAGNSGPATKTWVDANIQITPNGTNRVGATHTFTAHVNVNTGTGGYVSAPDGTAISFTIDSGPGGFTTANPCLTTGGTGSCQISLVSTTTGVTTVSAHTNVSVGGLSLHRDTNGTGANSGPARKTWVDAKISIAPNATNEVGAPHTFTVTLQKDIGDGAGFVAFSGAHVNFSLTNTNGATFTLNAAASTCDDAGANTNGAGQCVIVFTSNNAGKVTGHASWTGTLGTPAPFTVSTDGVAPNSGDAVKTFVDANIQINPPTANNPVSTNHTLVGHVNINAGQGAGYVSAPAGTLITFSLTNSGGATAAFVGPNTCTTSGTTGSCSIIISSSTTGTTTVKAATDVSVGGVSLHRETGDGKLGDSVDANKTWSDAVVTTRVLDAANADITNTTVPAGTVVHDEATVAKAAGTPAAAPSPSGTVTFTLYDNGTCNGAVVATDPNKPLSGGVATSVTFTTPVAGGTFSYLAHYNGDANYPARNGPCEPFTARPVPVGQITPTNVECADFVAGAPTLAEINYTTSSGKIAQSINPGVFFFWTTITTTVPNQVVTVTQTNTSTNNAALFTVHQGWDRLYLDDCSSYTSGTQIAGGSGASFTVATPGTYHIGVKYSTKSIAGTTAPVPDDITYNFATSLGGQTGASVLLRKH